MADEAVCLKSASEDKHARKDGQESVLERTEMRMVRWMCGTSLREKKTSAELRDRMGIEAIGGVLKRNRLRWFGHVERKEKKIWSGNACI